MSIASFNQVRVDGSALKNNFRYLQQRAGKVPVLAMVKGDGYGHGMIFSATSFYEAGCRHFGVAELCEGVALRKEGIKGEIVVSTCFGEEDVSAFFTYDLQAVITSIEQARQLNEEGVKQGKNLPIHIKINTGMGRLGILPGELSGFVGEVSQLPNLRLTGIMSHFPEADVPGAKSTDENFGLFMACCNEIKTRYGVSCHIANSAALLHHSGTHCDMIRAGISLYGYHPAGDVASDLQAAMRFTSRIIQIKEYETGTPISYGRTYITPEPQTIAVIPAGYEDGLDRSLSNRGEVLVGGKRAPIRGRVCMNMCMLDISHIPGVKVGDEVVILGRQGEEFISADEIAGKLGTINYEILCRFGHMNRFFVR